MSKVKVLLVSPESRLRSVVGEFLKESHPGRYELCQIENLESEIPASDVALLDEEALPGKSTDYLAKSSFLLSPRPLIYLMGGEPSNEEDYHTVKSLSADYLNKSSLTASGLHNTIRYSLENAELKLELEQQQRRYASLFYNSVEPSVFLDQDLTITGVNQAFLDIFKITSRQALNKGFCSFIKNAEHKKKLKILLADQARLIDTKVRFFSKNQDYSFLGHLRISPIVDSVMEDGELINRVRSYHGTFTNISHEERLRAVRAKSDKIAMTYRLARTMAHEIRNPLTNVNLAIDQLKAETEEDDDYTLYFDIIERCTKRIDGILDQLLRTSEKQVSTKSKIDGVEVLKDVITLIRDRSRLEGIELSVKYNVKRMVVSGDPEKLKIAFTNLFTNAIEAMNKEHKEIVCDVGIESGYLRVTVEDNGAGMNTQQLESLFDPFYTSKPNGVGLGLTSTQAIISEHEGEIEVESEEGSGSRFTIFLPLD